MRQYGRFRQVAKYWRAVVIERRLGGKCLASIFLNDEQRNCGAGKRVDFPMFAARESAVAVIPQDETAFRAAQPHKPFTTVNNRPAASASPIRCPSFNETSTSQTYAFSKRTCGFSGRGLVGKTAKGRPLQRLARGTTAGGKAIVCMNFC
jgi:hypothetical protein